MPETCEGVTIQAYPRQDCSGNPVPRACFRGLSQPDLAMLAWAGNKRAQLELGMRYEVGHGLPVDWERAERLYRRAASGTGQTAQVYEPASFRGERGVVTSVETGAETSGLPESQVHLDALRKRMRANPAQ
ncbi:MAG: SEL1-like repeat protein [Pseudomonadota bacterium]